MTYGLGQGANSVRLFHTWLAGTYDPAIQGAAYRVDFALDCARPSFAGEAQVPIASPMIEQGGRRFVPNATLIAGQWLCAYPEWQAQSPISSVAASEFVLADGPACGAGEACPDFSAQAAPLRFGFVTSIDVGTTSTGGIVVQGIDNWRVTVWRR